MGCNTARVAVDYDTDANFESYQTYAFYKPSVDKMEINDLDKKRILYAIDDNLRAKGMTKSKKSTLLIQVFTKEEKQLDIFQNNLNWNWGWSPWFNGGFFGPSIYTRTEGQLYINLVDAQSNQLIWQGKGIARLYPRDNVEKKVARIQKIVNECLTFIIKTKLPFINSHF